MDINEVKQHIKNNVKWEVTNPHKLGGQSCGMPRRKQKLISDEMNITIEIGYERSALKNRELAFTLFDIALDELVR